MKLSVIIPVFNERNTIREIVKRVLSVPLEKEIIVVDDASVDGTTEILKEMEKTLPLTVIYADENHGRGMAVRMGQKRATGDIFINQDADLEYDPRDYELLVQPIVEGRADAVYGSRFKGRITNMALKNYLGNKFLTLLCNVILGTKITDLMTGYKVLPRGVLAKLECSTRGFEYEAELTAKLVRMGVRITEVPVTFRGRSKAEGKKIGWRDAIKVMNTLRKYR
jgi:glycosyltransferase involved in cell wall biosynthesis